MLLAEELLLLALEPEKGTIVNGGRQYVQVGLVGALVAELALAGLVEIDGKRLVVVGKRPAEALLARAHEALAQGSGRRAAGQLRRLDRAVGGVWSVLVDRLVAGKVLGRRTDRVLLVPITRHPVLRQLERDQVLGRVRVAAAGTGPLDPPTAVLLALAGPCRLLEVVAPDPAGRRHAKDRIATATDLTPVAPVVKAVIAQMQAAAASGAMVAATAASS